MGENTPPLGKLGFTDSLFRPAKPSALEELRRANDALSAAGTGYKSYQQGYAAGVAAEKARISAKLGVEARMYQGAADAANVHSGLHDMSNGAASALRAFADALDQAGTPAEGEKK